ncbi:hypothetical protein O9G_001065 [Rozella allomycis CSF55]|uniref:F-box domain-containing protein n=1 Tax=Rozella allomycis (strain CSF55) TaxID=988480 RepID=A0A075AN06_ROZAC|nr:hypothetical protein O9G_001065 [Rozella allomycis CSF55]|eukprot:EPZ31154.1 hypothetical protein O9G_001065 [Rozella allomycis CSF55]
MSTITCYSRLITLPWEIDARIFDFLSAKEKFKRLQREPYSAKYKDLFKIISKCGIYMMQKDPMSKVEFKLDGSNVDISCFDDTDPALVTFFLDAFKLKIDVHYEHINDYVTKSHVIGIYRFDGSLRMTINDESMLTFSENKDSLVGISKLFVDIKTKQITQSMLDSIGEVLQLSQSVKHLVIGNLENFMNINNFNFCKLLDSFKNLESLTMIHFELRPFQLEYLSNNILSLGKLKTLKIAISYKHGYSVNGRNVMQIVADNLKNVEELHIDYLGQAGDVDLSNVKRLLIHGFFNIPNDQAMIISRSYGNLRELRFNLYYVSWRWVATHTNTVKHLIIDNAYITLQDMHDFLSKVSPRLEFLDLLKTHFAIGVNGINHFTKLLLRTNIKYLKLTTLDDNVLKKLKGNLKNKIVLL